MARRLSDEEELLMKHPLDNYQRFAAQMEPGPTLIIGGPGTGKTQALIARVRALMNRGIDPSNIAYLTLSEGAATGMARGKMKELLADREGADRLYVGAIHFRALGYLIRFGSSVLGRSPSFPIWDHRHARYAIETMVSDPRHGSIPEMTSREIDRLLQWNGYNRARWEQELMPAESAHWHEVIDLYNQEKLSRGVWDWDDLIPLAVQVLEESPDIGATKPFTGPSHLLVDEGHHLTPIQYRFLTLMNRAGGSITIAADPNQAIYGWRGADKGLLDRFITDYPDHQLQLLPLNHRATSTLVDVDAALTGHPSMTGLTNPRQREVRIPGPKPVIIEFDGTQRQMAEFLAGQARRMRDTHGYRWQDMAFIFRYRDAIDHLLIPLLQNEIPFHVEGNIAATPRNDIRRVTGLMASALDPSATSVFYHPPVVDPRLPPVGLGFQVLRAVEEIATENHINLIEAAREYLRRLRTDNGIRTALEYLVRAVTQLEEALSFDDQSLTDFCQRAIQLALRGSPEEPGNRSDGAASAAGQLLAIAGGFHRLPGESLKDHVARLVGDLTSGAYRHLMPEYSNDPLEQTDGITLSSVHASKGLQWRVVWVMQASQHLMPGRTNPDLPWEFEEEQRIFYVASTRATDRLIYCHAQLNDAGEPLDRSEFLVPLDGLVEIRTARPESP